MTINILRSESYRLQPWKNGKGMTAEIARFPSNTDSDFLWRFSMADIHESGAFSHFPGMTRTLVLLEGSPIVLSHTQSIDVKKLDLLEPYFFDGSWDTSAVVKSAGKDFNLISRTDLFQSQTYVRCLQSKQPLQVAVKEITMLIFCLSDEISFQKTILRKYDSLLIMGGENQNEYEVTLVAGEFGAKFLECAIKLKA
jgi:environmental stress-induced protein Ves